MTRYVFYSEQTGVLHPTVKNVPDRLVAMNTPAGFIALAHATADPGKHKIDISTKQLMSYQPPSPGPEYEWDAAISQWKLGAPAIARNAALAQIRALEASQPRAVREAALGMPEGITRLKAIEAQIAALRKIVSPTSGAAPVAIVSTQTH